MLYQVDAECGFLVGFLSFIDKLGLHCQQQQQQQYLFWQTALSFLSNYHVLLIFYSTLQYFVYGMAGAALSRLFDHKVKIPHISISPISILIILDSLVRKN